ncbi:SCO2524 family protein [Streptomyces sp. NPDC126510]|uniref:SCO2524 family protein n=1 Tax=Streptomyces sp. NPDC126510 TaxID=3155317 RepID=UPI003325227E
MRMEPRQHLLDVWRAVARHSFSFEDGKPGEGDRDGLSSVADAERLLCLLYPATEIPALRIDQPDTTERDVLHALESVGGRLEIPPHLIATLGRFMRTHSGEDGHPTFPGGHFLTPAEPGAHLTRDQAQLGVVDSYAKSVTLCLATLGFLKVYETTTFRPEARAAVAELRDVTGTRLTAAMISLLRSFTVNVFGAESEQGRRLIQIIGQNKQPDPVVLQQFARRFRPLRVTIVESLTRGVRVDESIRDENQLFECGWAWGVVEDAPEVTDLDGVVPAQPAGIADRLPYVYFTVVALDAIQNLFSERTLVLGLLDEDQQKLAEALRLRWELSQQYWSAVARFGADRWPLEDLPWRTPGLLLESEYFSLTVAAVLVQDLERRNATDDDLTRTAALMERLADRGRVTSRMTENDPARRLHDPGVAMPLAGSERSGSLLLWRAPDFSAQLLKRTLQLACLSRDFSARDRLLRLAEQAFEHLWRRRVEEGEGEGLWAVGPNLSWSMTERVTECLVAAYRLYARSPFRSHDIERLARDMLGEAACLLGQEQLAAPVGPAGGSRQRSLRNIVNRLDRARRLLDSQPGTAYALALAVLGELDVLAWARNED